MILMLGIPDGMVGSVPKLFGGLSTVAGMTVFTVGRKGGKEQESEGRLRNTVMAKLKPTSPWILHTYITSSVNVVYHFLLYRCSGCCISTGRHLHSNVGQFLHVFRNLNIGSTKYFHVFSCGPTPL